MPYKQSQEIFTQKIQMQINVWDMSLLYNQKSFIGRRLFSSVLMTPQNTLVLVISVWIDGKLASSVLNNFC